MIPQLYDKFQEWANQGTIWIVSDTHFGDEELRQGIPGRPNDDKLVKLINSKVGRKDTLIHLGDVGDVSYVQQLRAGRKILIMGNHDAGASNYQRKIEKWSYGQNADGFGSFAWGVEQTISDNHLFDEVYEGPVIIGPKLIFSHEPIMNFPYMFNIHGHVHCQHHNIPKHLNACLDVTDYQPIHFNSLMKSGIFKDIDDIHRVTIDKATVKVKQQIFKTDSINKNHQTIPEDCVFTYTVPDGGKPIKLVMEGNMLVVDTQTTAEELFEQLKSKVCGVYHND